MPSYAEIYASCLYTAGEGLPLWNPSPLRLGDVGFIRDGTFHTLFNCIDSPPAVLSNAANITLARRSEKISSRGRSVSDASIGGSGSEDGVEIEGMGGSASGWSSSRLSVGSPSKIYPTLNALLSSAASPPTKQSGFGGISCSPVVPSGLPMEAPPSPPTRVPSRGRASSVKSINTLYYLPSTQSTTPPSSPPMKHALLFSASSAKPYRGTTPPDVPAVPLPLEVDQERPKLFDMGPRMSSNYRCLGVSLGASVLGAPVSAKISFETMGGDGALLIPRDPTERTVLKHVGVLKEYVKTHRKWMYDTYGRIEDIDPDEFALIYGQDRTSDWAVAVSKDSNRGTKVDFEIFGSANAGFWGSWSHSLSASQRGPHRDHGRRSSATQTGLGLSGIDPQGQVQANNEGQQQQQQPQLQQMEIDLTANIDGLGEAHLSFHKPGEGGHFSHAARSPPPKHPQVEWEASPWNISPPDQTIIIRRVTARTSLRLGFLPARMKANAEPKDPDQGERDDNDKGRVKATDAVASATGSASSSSSAPEDEPSSLHETKSVNLKRTGKRWNDDPLDALHTWIHETDSRVLVSIASDDDCMTLLRLAFAGRERDAMRFNSFNEAIFASAAVHAVVEVDADDSVL